MRRVIFFIAGVWLIVSHCMAQGLNFPLEKYVEDEPYIKIERIENKPYLTTVKPVIIYRIVNPTNSPIKIILDPNYVNTKNEMDTYVTGGNRQYEAKSHLAQVLIRLFDIKGREILTTSTSAGSITNYDPLIFSDMMTFIKKYTLIIPAKDSQKIESPVPIEENCTDCRTSMVFRHPFLTKENQVYRAVIELNNLSILKMFSNDSGILDNYYLDPIISNPYFFRSIIIHQKEGNGVLEYKKVTSE